MKIEHIACYVNDLEHSKNFFEEYFGGKAGEMYHNSKTGLKTYFISFDEGGRLELMNRKSAISFGSEELSRIGLIHFAFSVGSEENVDSLTKKITNAGYNLISGPRVTGDGYYESCVMIFDGIQIEITV
ncbi:VOC family protein [Erysipelothrix anatis]|uniref:VOC family protein n=1 Tax=Erysipelothrix anatis TaxID=2683713 RepID=UPI00140C7B8F|nr:VOC family protein [Erysipelothrix anatis]